MTRFQKLTLTTAAATFVLVVVGAVVRSTGSGMGCPDWPLCHGALVPPLDDYKAWLEWIHRAVAAGIGFLVLGVAFMAWRGYRRRRSILWPALASVVVTFIQAGLGAVTVQQNNAGDTVTAHLATAMILLGLLTFIAIRARYPAELPARGASQRFTLLAAFTTLSVYALLLFGSHVTATASALVFPDWPLFNGSLLPSFNADPAAAALQMDHFLHRFVALVVGIAVIATAVAVMRRRPRRPAVVALIHTATALFAIQVLVGAAQIFTTLAAWSVALHLALGAAIWALFVAATTESYYLERTSAPDAPDVRGGGREERRRQGSIGDARPDTQTGAMAAVALDPAAVPADPSRDLIVAAPFTPAGAAGTDASGPGEPADGSEPSPAPARLRDRVRAYVALTKPRIIELLLVTTVPAMALATRSVPGVQPVPWLLLVVATLVGGTLAAGSANAINCYIDRDIDEVMSRTRRRPLPAHSVDPENALVFGLALGVVAFGFLLLTTNLLAAFLALLAIAFYVVVYTLMLKRNTPQNIVIGGAAGALPPVIGWAAVTGNVAVPALFLFAIVFYWTPPHFWALALRLSRDYAAAGVPMLPVVSGVRETNRQIVLYTILLVVLTLLFAVVAQMGVIYVVGAAVLGALFLRQAWGLWREGTGAGAVRLYRYSITYLTALFSLIAVDALLPFAR